RATALWIAYPLTLFSTFFKPFIVSLNYLANLILRGLGIHAISEAELLHSEEELRLLLAQEKHVSIASKNIVLNAMDFRKKQARHSMIPRKDIIALPIAAPVRENIEKMRAHKFSRYPVYKETIDNIIGIVNTKDIFKFDRHLKPEFTLESVLRDANFLPETVSLEKVLETILQKKNHLIVLADEFGGTAGIITLENVLEELVGPIQDEFDRERPEIVKLGNDEYLLDAALTTNDVERLIERELSPKDILSIGAFVIEQLGRIPQGGERVEVAGAEFTVERVNDRVIDRIRVKRLPLPEVSGEAEVN
ncbi:MAG: HlyC/CorC family transporter, partial [Ignavibacteriales bacterium]|nr:HlyC/CorC family transporter [Ignavibacteriales bacterium]